MAKKGKITEPEKAAALAKTITPSPPILPAEIEKVLLEGDLARLSSEQRLSYYNQLCKSLGLNPMTKPFEYLVLKNKLVLYAKKDCTEQLRNIHGVSITEMNTQLINNVFIVQVKAVNAKGRTDIGTGAVSIAGLGGDNLANAYMKAETKAKRRVTLSLCGLGMLDETELETIPDVKPLSENPLSQPVKEKPKPILGESKSVNSNDEIENKRDEIWDFAMAMHKYDMGKAMNYLKEKHKIDSLKHLSQEEVQKKYKEIKVEYSNWKLN